MHPSAATYTYFDSLLNQKDSLKEETHAARWGLLRGYSGKATKWVDFVMTDSTRRESCHSLKVTAKRIRVKRHLWIVPRRPNYWWNYRYLSPAGGLPPPDIEFLSRANRHG